MPNWCDNILLVEGPKDVVDKFDRVKSFLFCKNPSGDWYVTPI